MEIGNKNGFSVHEEQEWETLLTESIKDQVLSTISDFISDVIFHIVY